MLQSAANGRAAHTAYRYGGLRDRRRQAEQRTLHGPMHSPDIVGARHCNPDAPCAANRPGHPGPSPLNQPAAIRRAAHTADTAIPDRVRNGGDAARSRGPARHAGEHTGNAPERPSVKAFDSAILLLELQRAISAQSDFASMAETLCLRLCNVLGAARVSLGWVRKSHCEPLVSSDGPAHGMEPTLRRAQMAAMDESLAQQCSLSSLNHEGARRIVASQRVLAQRSNSTVLTIPVAASGDVLGAVIVELAPDRLAASPEVAMARVASLLRLIERLLQPLARLLQLAWRDTLPVHAHAAQRLQRHWQQRRLGQVPARTWPRVLLIMASALAIALLVPFEQPITSDARLEGLVERQVVAFEDGQLRAVHVRPGDQVIAGQLLATLGKREVELELDEQRSEMAQQRSEVDAAMAVGDRARMAGAQARIDQLAARIALLDLRLAQTDIRAPIAGTVLSGDHMQRLDAPVTRGESLFTIAPDESLRVIVEVHENRAQHVFVGQRGELALSALPWQRHPLVVTRVAPTASVVDNRNVVDVEARLQTRLQTHGNASMPALKPGQRGAAHLDGIEQSLAQRWMGSALDAGARLWWRWRPW